MGGAALVPGCNRFSQSEDFPAYSDLSITGREKELVQRLCTVIIPTGDDVKGASDLKLEDFVMIMANDCLDQQERTNFTSGLRALHLLGRMVCQKETGEFTCLDWESFFRVVLGMEEAEASRRHLEWRDIRDAKYFLNTVKEFTIQGFVTSEYFMTEIMPYSMLPGKFRGKVLIDPQEKVNIYD